MRALSLLLTDVEGSTRLWQSEPVAMDAAMRRHQEIMHSHVEAHDGWRPADQGEGDAVFAAFDSPSAALDCAVSVQRQLAAEAWPTSRPLRVRIALHVGEVLERDGNLFGAPVNRCARIRGLGSGGQTLASNAFRELVQDRLNAGVWLVDLGEHRMKDLTRPERIWQVDIDGLIGEFPPLASLDRARHNLPIQLSSFVGREVEVEAVRSLVAEHRLVTITGFGGMGKTRLALQVGAELADGDGDGVWLVDLSAETDPHRVPAAIAAVLGIAETGDGPETEVLRELADKRLLLILDNLEQIAGCASFVAELLKAAPDVRVLGTSRRPLHVRGEHDYALAPLSLAVEDELHDAGSLSTYSAVQLFIDRAVEVRHDFAVTNSTAAAVAAICARLDGHPLSIELAAARIKLLTPDTLLARLESALGVLTGSSEADRPERQQTLRATIAWSYDGVPEAQQRLLAALSVFPASAALDAIETICCCALPVGSDVLDALTGLVDASLVQIQPSQQGESRFSLLVSIREFAAEQLAATGLTEEVSRRHAQYYAQMALSQSPALEGTAEQGRALAALRNELPNLRAAFGWARERDTELLLDLAGNLGVFFWLVGAIREGLSWVNEAVTTAAATHADRRLAEVLESGSWLANYSGDWELGRRYADGCAELRRTLGDDRGLGRALREQAKVAQNAGEIDAAQRLLDEAAQLSRRADDVWNLVVVLNNSGDLRLSKRDFAAAYKLCGESLRLRQARGDDWGSAICGVNVGWALLGLGHLEEARAQLRTTLQLARGIGLTVIVAECCLGLAACDLERDQSRAAFLLGAAEKLLDSCDDTLGGHEASVHDETWSALRRRMPSQELESLVQQGRTAPLDAVLSQ